MVARQLARRLLLQILRLISRKGVWTEIAQLLNRRVLTRGLAKATGENLSPPALFEMATAYWVSQAIYVAAKLGIADLLRDRPQSCAALAASTGSDAPSLFRLMRALSTVGCESDRRASSWLFNRMRTVQPKLACPPLSPSWCDGESRAQKQRYQPDGRHPFFLR
jgi:Dimerisation domain